MADDDVEILISPAEREEMGLPPVEGDKPTIKVEIEGDAPPAAAPAADKPVDSDEAFAELRRQREVAEAETLAERQARQAAEQRAQAMEGLAGRAQQDRINADLQTVLAATDKVNADAQRAEDEYAAALEAGDMRLAAKKQREMAQAEVRLDKLNDLKSRIEAAKNAPPRPVPTEGRVAQPTRQSPADPVEARLQSGEFSRESAAWLRARPHFLQDRTQNAKLLATHYLAVAEGHKPDTPDYFGFLESKLDAPAGEPAARRDQAQDRGQDAPAKPPLRIAAPPSRQNSSISQNGRQISVRLTQQEKAFCDETGESYEDYAANKYALINEGKLTA